MEIQMKDKTKEKHTKRYPFTQKNIQTTTKKT